MNKLLPLSILPLCLFSIIASVQVLISISEVIK